MFGSTYLVYVWFTYIIVNCGPISIIFYLKGHSPKVVPFKFDRDLTSSFLINL